MKVDNGEDACGYFFNESVGIIATYDGCGGLGAKRYAGYNSKTGAYIASRIVGQAVFRWFNNFSLKEGRINESTISQIKDGLSREIVAELSQYRDRESSGVSLLKKSDLVRELPTTLSVVLFDYEQNNMNTAFIWAGDSRGYILTADEGLAQITIDDLTGGHDAFDNLYADGRLSNVVAVDGDFALNHKRLALPLPFIAITATDGCFGYFKTPMEFEYMLLATLYHADSPMEWEKELKEAMGDVAGDDYSLCFAVFGYKDFQELKNSFCKRTIYLHGRYINMLANSTQEEKRQMWDDYKKDYSRWLD
jgi:hypothetical protein